MSDEAPIVPARVSVVDFNMPFFSIVRLMLKWAIAAIPAFLILAFIGVVFSGLFIGLVGKR